MTKKGIGKIAVFAAVIGLVLVLNRRFGWSAYLADPDYLMRLKETVEKNYLWALCLYILFTVIREHPATRIMEGHLRQLSLPALTIQGQLPAGTGRGLYGAHL